jgi:predicted RNA binding protein YcfA (HicA-like mRNA interferase family)
MSRLRLCTYRELRKVAEAAGYRLVRSQGSHNVFENSVGAGVVIPDHGSRQLPRGLLRTIVKQLGLTIEAYNRLLDEI